MDERLTFQNVQRLLADLVPERPAELVEMEAIADRESFPIIGPAAGHFCYLAARLAAATAVFEMGSGFGYSTAWFARAVSENGGGTVHHVVWDEELSRRARGHLGKLGYEGIVRYHVAEAVAALREQTGPFDVIFCDIDKKGYPQALDVAAEKLRAGGVFIADNVLWHGRIFDLGDDSESTRAIREFTSAVSRDGRWTATIVPIRDGLLLARRN